MKRHSIRKASNFKLQAARSRFQGYLDEVENSAVARKWPAHLEVPITLLRKFVNQVRQSLICAMEFARIRLFCWDSITIVDTVVFALTII